MSNYHTGLFDLLQAKIILLPIHFHEFVQKAEYLWDENKGMQRTPDLVQFKVQIQKGFITNSVDSFTYNKVLRLEVVPKVQWGETRCISWCKIP